jgi:hypothetical protein
MDMA